MRLAVIPARGGSKRIPRKNIRSFCGKPVIAWSIDVALQSGCFDKVIVSTDDVVTAQIATAQGAEVPFIRPSELAGDTATTLPVIAHAISWCLSAGDQIRQACCIYATAPFLCARDLWASWEILERERCDFVFPVASFPYPIQRALRMSGIGRIEMFSPEHSEVRSQDLEEAFHDAGQFYWGSVEAWLSSSSIFGSNCIGLVIPRHRAQDIDTDEDWNTAEQMFRVLGAEVEKKDL